MWVRIPLWLFGKQTVERVNARTNVHLVRVFAVDCLRIKRNEVIFVDLISMGDIIEAYNEWAENRESR